MRAALRSDRSSTPSSETDYSHVGALLENRAESRLEMPADYFPEIILDSGAYTNYKNQEREVAGGKKKFVITRESYSDFVEANQQHFVAYFNLDKILPSDREEAARFSYENYKYMRSRGLKPIPVFHQGEDISWLHRILDDGAEYVAVAGASTLRSPPKEKGWYDVVWNSLVNSGGLPTLKVHALGDTKESNLINYPWTSCDSSSWAQSTGKGGKVHLEVAGRTITLSIRRDGRTMASYGAEIRLSRARDIEKFRGEELDRLIQEFARYGIDYKQLTERRSQDHIFRLFLGIMNYKRLQERMDRLEPRRLKYHGWVTDKPPRDAPGIDVAGPKIYLASWMSHDFNTVFKISKYPYILLSYAWMGGVDAHKLRYGQELWRENKAR